MADIPRPYQVPYLQTYEVYLIQGLFLPFPDYIVIMVNFVVLANPFPCLQRDGQQRVDKPV